MAVKGNPVKFQEPSSKCWCKKECVNLQMHHVGSGENPAVHRGETFQNHECWGYCHASRPSRSYSQTNESEHVWNRDLWGAILLARSVRNFPICSKFFSIHLEVHERKWSRRSALTGSKEESSRTFPGLPPLTHCRLDCFWGFERSGYGLAELQQRKWYRFFSDSGRTMIMSGQLDFQAREASSSR